MATLSIVAAAICASPAVGLTPLAPCTGSAVLGAYDGSGAVNADNGFVMYEGRPKNGATGVIVLELCRSGRALVVPTQFGENRDAPDYFKTARSAMDTYVFGPKPYTMKQMARGLKTQGIASELRRLTQESCGCHQHYPDNRGDKTPYR